MISKEAIETVKNLGKALRSIMPCFINQMDMESLQRELAFAIENESYEIAEKLQTEIKFREENTFGL